MTIERDFSNSNTYLSVITRCADDTGVGDDGQMIEAAGW